jgi:hypothetical protein
MILGLWLLLAFTNPSTECSHLGDTMSTLSNHVPPDSPYHDQPLELGEFRLVTVEETGERSLRHIYPWIIPNDSLRLVMRRQKLEDKPRFSAVSYVWGTATASVSVACNGKWILVTPTVFEMLDYLRIHELPLWIDAICINQQDNAEKATQIPLMGRIYANAASALVWLGPLPARPRVESFMLNFPHVCQLARNWQPRRRYRYLAWRGDDWPPDGDDFWIGLFWLLNHNWFRRLWTFQEAVLAARIVLVIGSLGIEGRDLMKFVTDGWAQSRGYMVSDLLALSVVEQSLRFSDLALQACETIQNLRHRRTDPRFREHVRAWPSILALLQSRHAKEPIDRIWATTALLPEDIQHQLAPMIDYSELGREAYWKTYIRWAKFIVDAGQSLGLLNYARSVKRDNTKLPSWCPDLLGSPAAQYYFDNRWNTEITFQRMSWRSLVSSDTDAQECEERRAAIHDRSSFFAACSQKTNFLQVRGFVTDKISEVVDDPRLMFFRQDDRERFREGVSTMADPLHAAVMEFYRRGLELAQSVYDVTEGAPSEIPIEYLMCIFIDHRMSAETPQAYSDVYTYLTGGGMKSFRGLGDQRRMLAGECITTLTQIVGHIFFATEGGRFGIASSGCKPGDTICTFYRGEPLYILRWPDEGERLVDTEHESNIAEFCGVAYVPHLMEQHQREAARLKGDEIFVIG